MRDLMMILAGVGLSTAVGRAEDKPAGSNPQMQAVLDELAALGGKPLVTLTPAEARKQPGPADAVKALLKKQGKPTDPEPVGSVTDLTFPGPTNPLPARVYAPKGDGPFPVLVYYHGGGWVIGGIDAYDASCRALCNAAGCLVVSLDYRRAPEHPFPAAADDAVAGYKWAVENAAKWKGDPKRVAIGGESAGGNLAAGVCLRLRETRAAMPVHQLLVYPVTNNDLGTPSYREHADAKPLNKAMMVWFFSHYVGPRPDVARHPYAFPLQSNDLAGLPPATVLTADIDPLRDDGKQYADKLTKAGVKTAYRNFTEVTHEFFGMGSVVDTAKEAVTAAADGLKSGFGK